MMASQSTAISPSAMDGGDISSGSGSPVPPENPEVIEEFATDPSLFNRLSLVKLSSLWTLRDKVVFPMSFGGVPT
jgi:hypothetical protein